MLVRRLKSTVLRVRKDGARDTVARIVEGHDDLVFADLDFAHFIQYRKERNGSASQIPSATVSASAARPSGVIGRHPYRRIPANPW